MLRKTLCLALVTIVSAGGPCGTADPLPTPTTTTATPDTPPPQVSFTIQPHPPVPPPPLSPPQPRNNANSYLLYLMDESLGTEDATITVPTNPALPITNDNSEGNSLTVGRDADGTLHVVFLRFDLYNLPRVIQAAQINFLLLSKTGSASSVLVDRLNGYWTESGTLIPNWTPLGYWTIGISGFWDLMNITRQYQDWVNGVYPNYGLMLRPNPIISGPHSFTFGSSENESVLATPLLEIWGIKPGPQKFRFPLTGKYGPSRVSGYHFGEQWRNQTCLVTNQPLLHTGTDFGAQFGDLVFSIEEGVVAYSTPDNAEGGYIAIEHHDDYGTVWTSVYEHVAPFTYVKTGASLVKGSILGTIVPGTSDYGAHLHLHCHFGRFALPWSIRGRLPAMACTTEKSPNGPEPALNNLFFDPETMTWEQ